MECNKDEAFRARAIAEKKMEINDFEGARRIALKAQNLYPELENTNHMLSICDVHCSALKKVAGLAGTEKDWYGILQVQSLVDESTVKKQYRRLALILHPDKNRFPGAEAAFKLICEANAVLSDPQKKAVYDSKLRLAARFSSVNPPPHPMNNGAQFNKHYGNQMNVSNGFNGPNQHQKVRPNSSTRQDVFWTCCPFCYTKYQYLREVVNKTLRCQKCAKIFTAYEVTARGAPSASKSGQQADPHVPLRTSQPADLHGKKVKKKAYFRRGPQNEKLSTEAPGKKVTKKAFFRRGSQNEKLSTEAPVGSARTAKMKGIPAEQGIYASEGASMANAAKECDLKVNETGTCDDNSFCPGKQDGTSNGDAINRESGEHKNRNRRRGKNVVLESSKNPDNSSDSEFEDITMEENSGHSSINLDSASARASRKSSRKRNQVSYNETNDDLNVSIKRSRENDRKDCKYALDGEDLDHGVQKSFPSDETSSKSENKDMGTVHPKENMQYKDAGRGKERMLGAETGSFGAATVEIKNDSDQESKDDPDEDKYDCPDPEFSDFEKERDENRFEANQVWACYDDLDGMPRFYCKIKKVSFPFKLSFTWLEPVPVDEAFEEWTDGELPVGCGSFRFGKTETSTRRLSFSHLMHCEKGKKRGSLVVYPRVGEVWALFRDWDLKWSSEPENHKSNFKYELVKILSNFNAIVGIKVGYLKKVAGFVCLFQRFGKSETIPPRELYMFSHCVPFSRMAGSERKGVPVGSFELDPAALPLNFNDLWCPVNAGSTTGNGDIGVNCPPELGKGSYESVPSPSMSTPKKSVGLNGINAEQLKVRRSPRGVNVK